MKVAADEYMASHPGVQISIETVPGPDYFVNLPRTLATGDAPDITSLEITPGPYDELVKEHLLTDMSSIWDADGLAAAYPQATLQRYTAPDGKHYAVNVGIVWMPVIYYNIDAFKKAGIEAPVGRVASLDVWYQMTDKLAAAGFVPLSTWISDEYGAAFMLASLTQSSCGSDRYRQLENSWRPGTTPTISWTDQCVLRALETLQAFGERGVFGKSPATMASDASQALFVTGKAAMYSSGSWETAGFDGGSTNLGFKYGWFLLPPMPGGEPTKMLVADLDALGISSRSANQALALDYVRTIGTQEFQSRSSFFGTGRVPARTDVGIPAGTSASLTDQYKAITALGAETQMTVAVPFHPKFSPLLVSMFAGEKTPAEVAADLEAAAKTAREQP